MQNLNFGTTLDNQIILKKKVLRNWLHNWQGMINLIILNPLLEKVFLMRVFECFGFLTMRNANLPFRQEFFTTPLTSTQWGEVD